MFNPFIGKDQVWLETKLSDLQDQLASCKTVVESGAGDVQATERIILDLKAGIEQVLAALYQLDQDGKVDPPGKYPREQCFRARRTMPRYIWGA